MSGPTTKREIDPERKVRAAEMIIRAMDDIPPRQCGGASDRSQVFVLVSGDGNDLLSKDIYQVAKEALPDYQCSSVWQRPEFLGRHLPVISITVPTGRLEEFKASLVALAAQKEERFHQAAMNYAAERRAALQDQMTAAEAAIGTYHWQASQDGGSYLAQLPFQPGLDEAIFFVLKDRGCTPSVSVIKRESITVMISSADYRTHIAGAV